MKPILITLLALPLVAFIHHNIPKSTTLDATVTAQKQTVKSPQKPVKVAVAAKVTPVATTPPKPATTVPVAPTQAPQPAQAPATPAPSSGYPAGSHEDWMAQAGIPAADFAAVDYIVQHESGWDPDATEPVTGAHGLPQALPYSKTGCGWSDPVCQLRWANDYSVERYGGWWAAQAYWAVHRNW